MSFIFIEPKRRALRKAAKSDEAQRVLDALDEYLEGNVEEPVKWLARFWQNQAAAFSYKELLTLVTDKEEPDRLFNTWFQDYSRLLADKITPMWQQSFLAGANSNPIINGIGYQVNTSETSVREWILSRGAELVTNVTTDQIKAIRYIIAESQAAQMSSAETARYIRPTVGLTERQAAANLRHYNFVKEQLRSDHPRMTDASIERKARESAAKYAKTQQMTRAETIARTEMAHAYNQGNDTAIRQAMNQGLVPIMRKVWSTADDGHVCSACQDLEGTEIDMDKEFKVTVGKKVKRTLSAAIPPLHPRCKCAVMYEETGEYLRQIDQNNFQSHEGTENAYLDYNDQANNTPEERRPEPLSRIYVNHKDKLYRNLLAVPPLDDYEDFGVHGVPNESKIEYETTNGVSIKYDAKEYAEMLRNDPEYHGGKIRLLSCGAGSDVSGFAKGLANELGVAVLAPTETLWTTEFGDLFITDSDYLAEMWYNEGKIDNSFKPTGYWKLFEPK